MNMNVHQLTLRNVKRNYFFSRWLLVSIFIVIALALISEASKDIYFL